MTRYLLAAGLLAFAGDARADVLPAPAPPLANANGIDEGYAHVAVGKPISHGLMVDTAPGKAVTYRAVQLPRGARLVQEPHPSPRANLEWTPTEDDIGESDAVVEVTDGHDTVRKTIHYDVHDDWAGGLMPSVGSSVFLPRAGTMVGVPVQLVLIGWAQRNVRPGASHGRIFVQVEPVRALYGGERTGAELGFGFDASFERTPRRRWLIPHYGLTFGSVLHRQLQNGGFGHATPQLGLYLWADRGVMVSAALGYVLPFSGFAENHGFRASLGITLSPW